MAKWLLVALAGVVLALGGCAGSQNQGRSYVLDQNVPYTSDTFHLDFTVVEDTLDMPSFIGGKPDVSTYALELHRRARKGEIPSFSGSGTLTIHMDIDASHLGAEVPYLTGMALYAGMAKVVPEGRGYSKVTIPVMGGAGLGQAALVLPKAPLLKIGAFVPCVETSFPVKYLPDLTEGTYKGRRNMMCEKPGKLSPSHTTDRIRSGRPGVLFTFVHGTERRI